MTEYLALMSRSGMSSAGSARRSNDCSRLDLRLELGAGVPDLGEAVVLRAGRNSR